MDFPTFQDLFRIGRDEALSKNPRLTREIIEREGTDANAMLAGSTAIGDECIAQLTRAEAATFLDSAENADLDRLVFDRYGLIRKPAAPAVGSVAFTTTTPAAGGFSIPVGTKLQTADGKQFVTTVSANFSLGSTGPLLVAVRSVLAGKSQQARIGTITSIIDMPAGAPADFRVSNTLATSGADDAEKDDDLRARARRFFSTARRGTMAAIEDAARAVPGVVTATAFEVTDIYGRPAKAVELVLADAFTEVLVNESPTPANYQTQSQVLAQTVGEALYDVRGAGVYINTYVASVVLQGITLGLSFNAGVNVDDVALRARSMLVAYVNSLAPGADLAIANLITQLRRVEGLYITGAEILSPTGTVVAAPLQVLRTTLGLVIATSVQPDRALQGSTNPDAV